MNSTRTWEIIVITNLQNGALGEDAALYTRQNCSKVAGIKVCREDKREARNWAACGGCGGSRSRHEFQCLTLPQFGD